MKNYRLIDHTADIGIEVKAKSYKELFVKAALGMFDIIAQPLRKFTKKEKVSLSLNIQANGYDDLLLEWLSQLISLSDSKELIFTDFKILKLTSSEIQSDILGVFYENFRFEREIKAVTYYHLKIEKKNKFYKVSIIFDV